MKSIHKKAVDAFKFLNDYCYEANCKTCVFHCLGDCPFYMLDEDAYKKLYSRAKELGVDKNDGRTED